MKRILSLLIAMIMALSCVGITAMAEDAAVTTIDTTDYDNFAAAMNAANNVSGAVEVEISGEVEFTDGMELKGNYTSIAFVGNGDDAKITIKQSAGGDYLEAHGKTVAFTDLTLAKANPAWSGNSGHMGNYFSVQGGTVTYTDCIFPNGACTNTGTATYNNCTFENTSEYGLWVYDDALVTVNGGTIDSTKGIKVYSEDETSVTSTLKVENATFTENVTAKPAVAIGYAESITLIGNTYNNTMGVLELDSGSDADCEGVSFVAQDANGNDIASTLTAVDRSNSNAACGVLVDGKIYTTVAQAAEVATAGSKVTLLHDSTETVEFAEGVTLDINGYTADGVTVATPVDTIDTMAELVEAVQTANSTITVGAVLTVAAGATYDLDLNGCTVKLGEYYIENNGTLTVTNGTIIADTYNSETNGAPLWNKGNLTVYENTVISGVCSAVRNDGGTCVIEAGTLNATCKLGYSASIIRMKSGSLTIKDGIFNGCDDVNLGEGCSILSADDGTTVIIGGTFNNFAGSPGAIFGKGIGVTVKGGTFNFENKQDGFTYQDCLAGYLAEGYGVDENGVVSPYVASIGDDKYTSLADAVAVANDAHGTVEIKMIKNVEIAPTAIKGSIVLDLNGCTIYTTHNIAFQLKKNAALTIKDTSVEQDGLVKVEHTTGGRVIDLAAYDNTKFTLESGNLWSSEVGVYTASSTATVIVKGGSIICNTENDDADALQIQRGSAEVTGGTFSSDVTTYCADGYVALPDLNGNFVVGAKPTATVNNLGAKVIPAGEYGIWNGSSFITGDVDMPLNFVMQFVADQDAEDMATSPYADWYADFVITFEGIEGDSFDPTGCYLAGYYGSTDSWDGIWVKIPVDGLLTSIVEGTRYPVMMGVGKAQNYEYICSGVQAFSCAMFIPNEILEANPDLKVNLELNVVDSSDDEKALEALKTGENIYKASETKYVADDFFGYVAAIGEKKYTSLQEALKALEANDTLTLLSDVTISELWDCRESGAKITVPVTIDGNGKTLKLTGAVEDKNWNTVFRFEENAIVKDLTIDISEATGAQRVITAKKSLDVDKLTIKGSAKYGIIFGEGATAAELANAEISIANSDLNGTRRAISDNEDGKDVKSVTITGNTLNANVAVSALETVTFTGNTVTAGYVDIRSYTADNTLDVTATGNTLDLNKGEDNKIDAGGTINAQDGFVLPAPEPSGTINGGLVNVKDANRTFLTIESYLTYANESIVVKVYDKNGTLLATSSLLDENGAILGKKDWGGLSTFVGINCTDEWWDTVWEKGKLNSNFVPAKATLIIDDVEMNTAPIQMRAAGTETEVVWADVPGVPAAELPNAEVTNLGAVSVTANDGDGDYKFGKNYYYVYDLLGNQQQKLKEETTPFEMNIAMQFVAKDTPEQAEANAYANYTTDFFIKIDGIKDGSFVGNGCYLAGYYPSFEAWVKIPLDGFTVENGKVYPVISSANFDFKYVDICTSVKDFICGIYLTPEIIAENPDIKVNLTLGLSENLESAQNADFTKVDDYTYDAEDFKTVELFDFTGATVTLGNAMQISFFAKQEYFDGEDYFAIVEHDLPDGTTSTTRYEFAEWEARNLSGVNYYAINYSNLAARQIADEIRVTIYRNDANQTQVSNTRVDGLSAYAYRTLGNTTDSKLRTALVDMLNYGAAAQLEFDYNTGNLANANAGEYQQYATTDISHLKDERVPGSNFVGTTLTLKNNIQLTGYFKNLTSDMYAVVNFKNHYGDERTLNVAGSDFVKYDNATYGVCVDNLVIADAAQLVTITVYNADGTVYGTLVDSINGYLKRSIEEGAIYEATAKFTLSAYNTLH